VPFEGLGSEPSVVYRISATPEAASLAESETETAAEYQPAEQAAPSQAIELAGATPSGSAVKLVGGETRPALLVAVTSFGSAGSLGEPVWLYVAVAPATERLQPVAAAGKL